MVDLPPNLFSIHWGLPASPGPVRVDMGLFTRFLGFREGKLFGIVPPHVDTKLPPGASTIPLATFTAWLKAAPTVLWHTSNGGWALLALALYLSFPYDLSPGSAASQGPLTFAFFAARFPMWLLMTLVFYGFWHITLYGLGFARRPFVTGRKYSVNKVAHNMFWGASGLTILVGFENVFAFLWATGRLPYESDAAAFGSLGGFIRFIAALVLTPLWRNVHFYFAHRLIHFGPLYTHIHALHHRNTDIEPFAGISMHPMEHLYYYTSVLPSLFLYASPFAFFWNAVHLIVAPTAAHSGWEDHSGSSSFHYMHHRYFEVNYSGSDASFMDELFGTFRSSFKENDKGPDGAVARADAKATLWGAPSPSFVAYLSLAGACIGAWAYAAVHAIPLSPLASAGLALLPGFGPIAIAFLLSALSGVERGTGSAPESARSVAFHGGVGTLLCAVPIAWAAYITLRPQPRGMVL